MSRPHRQTRRWRLLASKLARVRRLRITSGITGDAEQDAYTTILNGMNTGARYNAQAQADRLSGRNAATSGYINAGSSLLSAAGSGYSGWKKAGPTTTSTGTAASNNMFSNMGVR
ncbi:hypothetical protein [Serratia nevei]|uniref:hypothetical protein n=1 Tax=Serratia nevei TaxID=2703794 RepID=UPI00313E060A